MPKKTTILIAVLALITGVLIFLAIGNEQTQEFVNKTVNNSTPTPIAISPYATFGFFTPEIDATSNTSPLTADIIVDTNDQPIAGLQVELSYDPAILKNMKISAPASSFLGTTPVVLINKVDPVQGRISYAAALNSSAEEKSGKGIIATLTFTISNPNGIPETQISFLPKSMATTYATAESVLKSSTPLRLILTAPTSTQVTPAAN